MLLEPIMEVEVVTPEEFMGDVIGNLNSKRGKIKDLSERAGAKVIRSEVPLSGMFGYSTDLRSATQGRATFSRWSIHEVRAHSVHDCGRVDCESNWQRKISGLTHNYNSNETQFRSERAWQKKNLSGINLI